MPTSLAARIQAGATGPGWRTQLREHGLTLRHFPQSFEYSTLGGWVATRAGRPLRDPLHPHRRPGRVGAGDHAARDLGEPAAARLRGGPLAGPGADRLRGNPRRDRRGLGAGPAAARVQDLLRGRVRRLLRRRAAPCARSPSRVCIRRTAACSTRSRRARPAPAGREEPAGARLRVGRTIPVDAPMELALAIARDARRRAADSPPTGRRSDRASVAEQRQR